ncbi:MAG: DNA-deoxyinosine glycosylase [Firmicutes bacterium]|nr:DNA-deoxyinosine glycosylase [Bacillota bacterium]
MSRIVGFPPITHTEDQVLILGSMPSVESLKQDMYYANKTNRFWPMLGKIFELPYQTRDDKLNLVKSANIAIWDVCYSCQRETSADAKIRDIIPNDIAKLLKENPSIQIVICNGKTSYDALRKYFPEIQAVSLPSTSAANAKYRLNDLIHLYQPYIKGENR